MVQLDDTVREFLVESHENLDRLDEDFLRLERAPGDAEVLGRVFRTIHTLKGTAGCLGFGRLEAAANAGENLLSALRTGKVGLTPERSSALLALVDATRAALARIEASGSEGEVEHAELVATLERVLREGDEAPRAGRPSGAPAPSEPEAPQISD